MGRTAEQGRTVTSESLCRDCPELLPEVREKIELEAMYRIPNGVGLDHPVSFG